MNLKNKKIILGARTSAIEPLGLLYLSTISKQEGFLPKIVMADKGFRNFDAAVKAYNPSIVGFSCYTGNHQEVFDYLFEMKQKYGNIISVLGGPHASFFPKECSKISDYVVLSEGFNGFRRILQGKAEKGIVPLIYKEDFPKSDREDFYRDNPEYGKSPIKSIIASQSCPYACSYCYNSSTLSSLEGILNEKQMADMSMAIGGKRLYPRSIRSVDEVIAEVQEIRRSSPNTRMLYFQDDVFGVNPDWVRDFTNKYKAAGGLPFHAQMRFETADPKIESCRTKLYQLREAGCTGLTFAIESPDPVIREEVLNRNMRNEMIFNTMRLLSQLGYKVRTEQILGLPRGATSRKTKINLEADLETLKMNVDLRKETGLPTMAWASIFAPYKGTKIEQYCQRHGFYSGGNNDVPETFFQRSVLRFPESYVGPTLNPKSHEWMMERDQDKYRDNMLLLRDLFSYFALVPEGHKLAETFIKSKDHDYAGLSRATRRHLYNNVLYDI